MKTYLQCSAQRLIVEDGAVKGVQVQHRDGGGNFTVRPRKGVILATGGYQANPFLRRHFQPDKAVICIYPGLSTCRRDGRLLGQAVGFGGGVGGLVNMTMIPPIVVVPSYVAAGLLPLIAVAGNSMMRLGYTLIV